MAVQQRKQWVSMALAAAAAFCVYTGMFAFRKPFSVANFEGLQWAGVSYKVWLVVAQTLGYTLSKFWGIRFIAELRPRQRFGAILFFITAAWAALLFFALVPAPWNIFFLLLNGFPLGIIYGLVFSYLEGRRTTELLGAVLAASFIFASGFAQSAGKYLMVHWGLSQWWMPFATGALFLLPTFLFARLLDRTPPPTPEDVAARTERRPMDQWERRRFIGHFWPGLLLLVLTYILLTVIRDYRSNFASNIWTELGEADNAAIYTQTELPATLLTLGLMGLLIFIRSNLRALMVNHAIVAAGFLLSITMTLLFQAGTVSAFWWMTGVGIGLYMGYVPFNCMLFDRLIATFRYVSNAGFLIYLADSFGYLGSDAVLLARNFWHMDVSWSAFFEELTIYLSAAGFLLTVLSAVYFRKKKSFSSTKDEPPRHQDRKEHEAVGS